MAKKKVGFVERRKILKLTQPQVAQEIGVSLRTVQRWEMGDSFPELSVLQAAKLCNLLQCSIQELAADFYPDEFAH